VEDLEEDSRTIRERLGRRGLAALALAAIIVASGVFYMYRVTPRKMGTQTDRTHSLRYDEALLDGFEAGRINLGIWNVTGAWSLSTGPRYSSSYDGCYQGSLCVWSGTVHNRESQLVLNFSVSRTFVNYASLLLNFSLWVDTNTNDVLYVDYFNNGNWNVAAQYSGLLSTTEPVNRTLNGWFLPQLELPTTTTMTRFRYLTGCCENLYRGVLIDEVGVYMVGPGSFGKVIVTGHGSDSAPLSVPVSMDDGPYFKTLTGNGFNIGLAFLASPAKHTLTVPSVFSDGSESYELVSWDDGSNSSSRLVTVPTAGNLQFTLRFVPRL